MKRTYRTLAVALAAAWIGATAQAQTVAGNAQAGAGKIAMCIGCHGITGYQSSFPEVYKVPKISGQTAAYLSAALVAYRKGDRKHPTMRAIAGSLSDQDIADVSAYYAASGGPARTVAAPAAPVGAVAELLNKGACVSCHGADFTSPIDPSYPRIAGQHPDYLYVSLKAYRDSVHPSWGRANPIMAGMAKQFSNDELRLLARYIGTLDGTLKTVPEPRFR